VTAGPATEVTEPAQSIPTDSCSVALPIADVPFRRPTLGRAFRCRRVLEVRWRLAVDQEVETALFRREPAAHRLAGRLRAQGVPVVVAEAAVSGWAVIG